MMRVPAMTRFDIMDHLLLDPGHMYELETRDQDAIIQERGFMTVTRDFDDRFRLDMWNLTPDARHWGEFYFRLTPDMLVYHGNRIDYRPQQRMENIVLLPVGVSLPRIGPVAKLYQGYANALSAAGNVSSLSFSCGVFQFGSRGFAARWALPNNFTLTLAGEQGKGLTCVIFEEEQWKVIRRY